MGSEIEFISLANRAGIHFTPGRHLPWLTNKGHLAEPLRGMVPADVLELLGDLFRSLGGDEAALRAKRAGSAREACWVRPVPGHHVRGTRLAGGV